MTPPSGWASRARWPPTRRSPWADWARASRRWRCPQPTRRCPPTACTPSPSPSPGWRCRTAPSTTRPIRNPRRVVKDGVAYEVTKVLKADIEKGTSSKANIGTPGRRQDRFDRESAGRLVRGLHAGTFHLRLDRLSRRAVADDQRAWRPGLGRRFPGDHLEGLHDGRSEGQAGRRNLLRRRRSRTSRS